MVFEIAKHLQLVFYEVPYINLPSVGLITSSNIERGIKGDCKPEILTKRTYFSDQEYAAYGELVEDCLKDTVNWYTNVDKKNPYAEKLESVLLSLLYKRAGLEARKDYNWHVVLSEIHYDKSVDQNLLLSNH